VTRVRSRDQEGHASLIGRRLELTWLRGRLELALGGYPHLVLVEGEAGIGKTRLVSELLDEARQQQINIMRGRCYEHLDLAYFPLRESVFSALSDVVSEGTGRDADRSLLERVSDIGSARGGQAEETDAAERSRQLFALTQLVIDAARLAPTIVFLDDLDWADDATIALLRHILFRVEDEPISLLMLATTRADPGARAAEGVAHLRADRRSATLSLQRMSGLEATELARGRRAGMTIEQARELAEAGGGNPLLIEALTRQPPSVPWAPPMTVASRHPMMSAIEARLDALSPDAAAIVRALAFLVPDDALPLLAEVTELGPTELRSARNEAIEHGVLVEDERSLLFAHPLYEHIAYTQTPVSVRHAIHARAASALLAQSEAGDPVSVRSIAHHLAEAGQDADSAVIAEYARRAGDEALTIGAWGEAATHYETALAAIARTTDDSNTLAGLHRLAGLSRRANLELTRAVAHLDAAIELLGPDGDDENIADLQMWRIRCGVGTHELLDVSRDRVPLEQVFTTIESTNPWLAADALVELSQSYWVEGLLAESERASRRAMDIASSCGNHLAHARAATSLTVPQWARYDVVESLAALEDASAEAAAVKDQSALAGGPSFRVPIVLAWLGRLDEADARAQECCTRAEQGKYPLEEGLPLGALALVCVTRGDFDRADYYAHKALLVQRLSGYHWAASLVLEAQFAACVARGRYDAAADALDTWTETAEVMELTTIALLRRLATALERGLPAQGDRLPRLPRHPMVGADAWAAAQIEIARREDATVDVQRAHDLLLEVERRGGVVTSGIGMLVPRVRGVAADLLGDEKTALTALESAITTAKKIGAEPEHARALVDVATIRLRRGERRETFALIDDALERFEHLGMGPDAERARQLVGDPGSESSRRSLPTAASRTDRAPSVQAVILFTDVVDSTRLTEELGTIRYRQRARALEELVTSSIKGNGGTIVSGINLGDGFIGLFSTVEAAIAVSRTCARAADTTELHMHIALHAGEIVVDGPRIFGTPVNYAARLCALTGPDEIIVSDAIRDRASDLEGVAFVDRGEHALKGIAAPQRLYELIEADAALSKPR